MASDPDCKGRWAWRARRLADAPRKRRQQLRRPVHGLDGAETQARQGGLAQNGAHQFFQRALRLEVPAPAPQVDAGEHQLGAAGVGKSLHLARQASRERERLWPRVVGMMQKEQRFPQPSCTLRLGRVWPPGYQPPPAAWTTRSGQMCHPRRERCQGNKAGGLLGKSPATELYGCCRSRRARRAARRPPAARAARNIR